MRGPHLRRSANLLGSNLLRLARHVAGGAPLMTVRDAALKPLRGVGAFYAMALDTFVCIPRRPVAWQEFLLQCWFVARVSVAPALLLAVPFTVLTAFTLTVLLVDFGAADAAGTGAGVALAQLGPIVTVLVVAGAGATAICADLGA